jgi:hypothetical protein
LAVAVRSSGGRAVPAGRSGLAGPCRHGSGE